MSKENRASRPNFEYWEYVGGTATTIVLTVLDIWSMGAFKPNHAYDLHEYLEGFLLSLIVGLCVVMLVRWYRTHDEILEAERTSHEGIVKSLEHTRSEILDSVELSRDLAQFPDLESRLSSVAKCCIEIEKKNWPPCARNIALSKLDATKNLLSTLRSGAIDLPYSEAIRYSPTFFQITKGISFVTDYGNDAYWRSNPGKLQLDANKKVIKERGRGTIVRVFIVPPYCSALDRRHTSLDDLDDILDEQINAEILVSVVSEIDLPQPFRRDVGVFFQDLSGESCHLMSDWSKPHSPDQERRAVLYFEGNQLTTGRDMYAHLITDGNAEPIVSHSDWQIYKNKLGRQRR